MYRVLIAGAGQLGSRHLQGVKTSTHDLDIWVYDLSEESLKIAEDRYNQIESDANKTAHFISTLDTVPSEIDVVIVASSSKPRAIIIKQILSLKKVKYMVLEKFLFTCLSEYDEIGNLIKEKNVKTWVNCPRRMWEGYEYIQKHIDNSKPISFEYEDEDWGLCCNTIHYLDIFMKLSGCNVVYVNIDEVIPKIIDSKRLGYVELHGTEIFTTNNNSRLLLTSTTTPVEHPIVKILNADNVIKYNEAAGIITINEQEIRVKVHYQSGLSGILVDELIEFGTCRLSLYDESASYHKTFLKVIGPFINKLKGWNSDSCPIT